MTKTVSIVLAFSLFINEITLVNHALLLKNRHFASNLVFLVGVSLLLKRLDIIPNCLWRTAYPVCLVLEVLASLFLLEFSLHFIWNHIKEFLLQNSDGILACLSENQSLDWIVCLLCCGKGNCSVVFSDLLLTLTSFFILVTACGFVS